MPADDRLARVEGLYHDALEQTPATRAAFVAAACGPDNGLRRELSSLLRFAAADDEFLEHPAFAAARPVAGQTLGHYQIVGPLGAGGMAEVYRARDLLLDRDVALKLVVAPDPARRVRLEREARAAGALTHPNIVTIYSVEACGDLHFLTMELVDGVPLGDRIPREGLSLERLLEIAVPLADAIGTAHRRGIVHRDLKPSNIMLTPDGRVKVLDFGIAKLEPQSQPLDQTGGPLPLTTEGCLLGTVAYMSPEQAEGRVIDHRSDIFSLGVLLHELATGRRPFAGDTSLSLLASILKDTPAPVTQVRQACPQELARIVRRCLAKDPERRYQSAIDLRNDLDELRHDLGGGGPVSSRGGARWAWQALLFWALRLGVVVGAGLGGAATSRMW